MPPQSSQDARKPILVSTLNADSGIDWYIKVTVNKKHPVKTHAKGQLFKVDLIDELDG